MAHIKPETIDHWTTFTKRIYNEWDADPGYYAIQHSDLPQDQQLRLAIAWCTYYNLGIAADASELKGLKFWNYLRSLYPTAKRATERRHFRGNAGLIALDQWQEQWQRPEKMAEFMCDGADSYFDIRKRGQKVAQYGDYFYWKWCDLHEVLGFGPVDMYDSAKHSPKTPQQGAELIYSMKEVNGDDWIESSPTKSVSDIVQTTYDGIVEYGRKLKIPPRTTDAREFGIQEAETVCCVYKQMSSGSYAYGTRTAKAIRRLRSGKSATAQRMVDTLLSLSPYSEDELNAALDGLTK